MKFSHLILLVLACLALVAGCSKDDNPVNPPAGSSTTTLVGSLAGTSGGGAPESGRLTLSFPAAKLLATAGDTLNVSGALYMSTGDTITLTGIYVSSTGYLYVTGGGYTIQGVLRSGHLTASYTGPGGSSGSIAASTSGGGKTIVVYCGHYTEQSGGSGTGTFNMIVDGTSATVITSTGGQFYGTVIDGVVTIYLEGTGGTVLASGNVTGTHAEGVYDTPEPVHGIWSADVCE